VIAGPVTGRLSCRFFHQIPKIDMKKVCYGKTKDGKNDAYVKFAKRLKSKAKDKKIVMRDMFIAPEGSQYVYGDFSQVELRILAIISNDTEMLKIMADPKGDLHATTAYEFLKNKIPGYTEAKAKKDKFNRTEVGKRVNFGLAYGSEGWSLVATGTWMDENGVTHNFTWDMLDMGMAAWKERFKGVGAFIDLTPDLVRSFGGTATNVFGRERHFGGLLSSERDGERRAAERECVNFFIQSVAAAITNRTIIAVDKLLKKYGISDELICLVNTVHDSVAYEVADHLVEWFKDALVVISQQPFPELGGASFKMDCGVGQNWTDAEMAAG
jgi:DNA polymerase-1